MRLTNKNSLGSYFTNIRPIDSGLEKDLTIYGEVPIKLALYENIDEELGIEYPLLNKLRHSKEVYIKNDSGEIVIGYIDSINIRKYLFTGRYKGIADLKKGFRINFRDYGKKIALTREELE